MESEPESELEDDEAIEEFNKVYEKNDVEAKKIEGQKTGKTKRTRRYFSGEHKRSIVEEYDSSTEEQQKALLQRENITSRYIFRWRGKLAYSESSDSVGQEFEDEEVDSAVPVEQVIEYSEEEATTLKDEDSKLETTELEPEEQHVCPACGEELTPDDTSCPNCGAFLKHTGEGSSVDSG